MRIPSLNYLYESSNLASLLLFINGFNQFTIVKQRLGLQKNLNVKRCGMFNEDCIVYDNSAVGHNSEPEHCQSHGLW